MKETNLFQDALEREIQDLLAPYPDPMGRTAFRKACRIGTRTSIYLLQSGLVPCENTGKQTRCYKIAKADVAAYLRRRLAEPAYWTLTRSPRSQAMPPAPAAAGVPRGGSSPFPISTPIKCPKSGCWSSSPPRTTTALREKARGTTP